MKVWVVSLTFVALILSTEAINISQEAALSQFANSPPMVLADTLLEKLGHTAAHEDVKKALLKVGTSPTIQMALDWLDTESPSHLSAPSSPVEAFTQALTQAAHSTKESAFKIASNPNVVHAFATSQLGVQAMNTIAALDEKLSLPSSPVSVSPSSSWLKHVVQTTSNHANAWQNVGSELFSSPLVNALELESATTGVEADLKETHTFVDSVYGGSGYVNYQRLAMVVSVMLVAVAMVTLFVLLIAVISFFVGFFVKNTQTRNTDPLVNTALSLTWLALSAFLVSSCAFVVGWNKLTLHFGDQVGLEDTGSQDVFKMLSSTSLLGVTSDAAVQVALQVVSGTTFDTGSKGFVQHPGINYPNFCEVSWNTERSSFNQYPPTSDVYDYNMRRVSDLNTDDNPDLDYVKTLLNLPNYPPRAGGMTSEQAHMFSAVSNECEDYHGDVAQCCDPSNCDHMNSQLCLQSRCPGQQLRSRGGSNACKCMEVQTHLGLVVEHSQISLCAAYIRDYARDKLHEVLGTKDLNEAVRKVGSYVIGCKGVYGVSEASLEGAVELKAYGSHAFTDNSKYSDNFLAPTSGASGEASATWRLTACDAGSHQLEFRLAGTGEATSFQVYVNDLQGPTVAVPAGDGTEMVTITATVSLTEGSANVRAVFADASKMPFVHKLAVKK